MQITLDEGYNAMCDFVYLGYVGEVNAREISVLNYAIPEATAYKLKIEYPDKTVYELPIKNGMCSLGASIFKTACEVKCQIVAYAVEGEVYKLVRKSDIFKQEIRSSIDESGIPSYEESLDALDKILQYESNSKEYAERAEQARDTAVSAKERAVSAENTAVQKADEADKSAQSAKNSEQNAAKSAERAESVAEVATASANQARDYAKEAAKAATNAGLSADTATQAASRAETAKTSAETSATQADTAMQGAETARAEAVKSQNDAKVSAAQASTSAQQTTADKNITAGYAKTAKTNADSTAADRQAVQTLAEQVTADKAIVAENAAKVATDRKAAETAAQTAQSIADSLPDDYVTAVGKIAENTAEIGRVKLTDKELQRRVNALYDLGNGVTHQFETDSETAYAKTVPTGAKLMSVKNIGGRSIVFNQIFQPRKEANNGATVTADSDGTITINGTTTASYINFRDVTPEQNKIGKYMFKLLILNNPDSISMKFGFLNRSQSTPAITSGSSAVIYNQTQSEISLGKATGISGLAIGTVFTNVKIKIQIFDLTTMFGAGNEPTTVEEFEKIFPAAYYPYNAGEIVSAGTEEVVEQGKNLWDIDGYKASDLVDLKAGYWGVKLNVKPNSTYCISVTRDTALCGIYGKMIGADKRDIEFFGHKTVSSINAYTGHPITFQTADENYVYVTINSFNGFDTWKSDFQKYFPNFQIEKSSTATAYTPYHRNTHPIPEAIKALPGYGWSAGNAKNYVDYENKKYVQCVSSVDLGTLDWKFNTSSGVGNHFYGSVKHLNFKYLGVFGTTVYNVLCSKYRTVSRSSSVFVDKTLTVDGSTTVSQIQVKDTAYTDAAAFKQAMSGVILYYELANPIITDISDLIPDDFLRNLTVEAGGTITFKNSNGDSYRIPVPNEEEYVVKLSEIGGTT